MNIGEKLLALVAFEEAMNIEMNNYEEGNDTSRISADVWSLLHSNRISQDGDPDRVCLLKEIKSQ